MNVLMCLAMGQIESRAGPVHPGAYNCGHGDEGMAGGCRKIVN